MLILVEYKAKKYYNLFLLSHDFLVKVITRYTKMHYEKSQNVNFLVLIRSFFGILCL